ncbi:helicase-related protein [Runella slithyformis]|uniref:Helicase domain-containing protein n=1 Tax=Runella slithyformis (strain ATCC 29530 / DSM 19594 / LMG 11500 / NCIMB 11436 / LSU 4) TaxID=761193 RepID=A0A7U3ZNU1_RUNSL|nr:helicase-related protein [Runella slithyformis]AEI50622.1 helicase domain-containing protein [Runella slithyformis DSM 19594]
MPIQPGQIVKNLIPSEAVTINQIQPLGSMVSLKFTGVNSKRANTKVISKGEFEALEVLAEEGTFNFKGDPTKFALFAEAERINSAYQFDPLFAVNCSIVDPLPHQVEAVYKFLLPMPKIRFLLADDTGAGKTIMTGLLIKELMMRGLAERILIITPGGLTKQWQEDEMGVKFNIPFTLVNRSLFSSDPTIFHTAQRVVSSIDFMCREDVLNVAGNSHWDLVVFDECHKLSAYDYGSKIYLSQRYKAAQVLSQQCEHILLLTATPHRGRKDTFKKLLQLLDEDIFATDEIASTRIKELEHNGINKFFIRRLKEDMKDWQGNPLFKSRYTKTVAYQLTPEEKDLYEAVTRYLSKKKEEATETKNIHVSLALTVMQRRLVSSIYAIKNTLERRWKALQGIVDEVNKNPNLWNQRHKLEGFDVGDIEEFEELEDDERDALENILSDPRKFKLFTTAKSLGEIQLEAIEVKKLFEMAQTLYHRKQEEKKFQELQELLKSNGVLDKGEKLVIFTEHKDTLLYLEERLTKSGGYKVVTIHGGKMVDERREAQWSFAKPDTQILIATDAAGEGINLQFCRLLINWDIPWNPNRLEQRMGRIHRYGQKQDVLVFNMVASNTKEGKVLERLLTKLDIIREGIGDDRVYDVIQDVLEGVGLDDIINSVFNGKETDLDRFLAQEDEVLKIRFTEKIKEQKAKLAHSTIDFKDARILKENSDEKRLQPIYIRLFFEKAFKSLGGAFTELRPSIYRIDKMPDAVVTELRDRHKIHFDALKSIQFCFDKQVFLDYQNLGDLGKVHYINPGNPVFDSLVKAVRNLYREDMIKGTILVSPDDKEGYFAFFVKSQIVDNRPGYQEDSIADERLVMVHQANNGEFQITSPAKFLDLHAPTDFTKPIEPPTVISTDEVIQWSFEKITVPQFDDTKDHVLKDAADRKKYLESAFTRVIMDLQIAIQELQTKVLLGDTKVQEKILKKQERINELIHKKESRLASLELMAQLSPKAPEVLGCAYVVPLTQLEYKGHYGMSRDDEAEAIAMKTAMDYESSVGWKPVDVSANNEGYDIKSISSEELKRYIEVKGRSGSDGSVMLSENEMNRLAQLGDAAWLYIVMNCKSEPKLYRIQNPAKALTFELKSKGVQYFLPMNEWKSKLHSYTSTIV